MRDPLKPIEVKKVSVLPVTEISQVAEARRAAVGLAAQLAFDEADIGTIALIVTEAATNLAKHATGGKYYCTLCSPVMSAASRCWH